MSKQLGRASTRVHIKQNLSYSLVLFFLTVRSTKLFEALRAIKWFRDVNKKPEHCGRRLPTRQSIELDAALPC